MHVPTHNFGEVSSRIEEIQKRVIDALFHVRDADGPSGLVVSVFLPEAQCHALVELDDEDEDRCRLTIVSRTVEAAGVKEHITADDYEAAVQYVKHLLLEFDERRTVSNVVVTTDGRRVKDVRGLAREHESTSPGESGEA